MKKKKEGNGMTYAGVGVDYEAMDPFKRMCQEAGLLTAENIFRLGLREVEASRGESAYLVESEDCYFAHVEEGLGTKNLVADAIAPYFNPLVYSWISQCCVAMIVNDIITLGALPVSVAMHLAVGSSDWFKDEERSEALVNGWRNACFLSRCVWGGGETPTLKGIVNPETFVLSGSAFGIIKPKSRLIKGNIQDGDAIVLFGSSGIHANGLTLAREIAAKLPDGFLTPIQKPKGKITLGDTYGGNLLAPTVIYVPLVEDCLEAGIDIHYAVNITGHGWRKLMRHPGNFAYIIEKISRPQPIFRFIQKHGPVSDQEAYGNLNMGAGFALYVPQKDVKKVLQIARQNNIQALNAGRIAKAKSKYVYIIPKQLTFTSETLKVRA